MSGGTRNHSVIGANISGELRSALLDRNCTVCNSELMFRIEAADAAVYPDGMVICGPESYYHDRKDVVTNPMVVVEVLSDSTASWDRGGKFRQYELLPSLQEYVLIEQNEPQVDVFRRNEHGLWELERYGGLDELIIFKTLKVEVAMASIYHRVEFPEQKQNYKVED